MNFPAILPALVGALLVVVQLPAAEPTVPGFFELRVYFYFVMI